jgi:hypothetical protein
MMASAIPPAQVDEAGEKIMIAAPSRPDPPSAAPPK